MRWRALFASLALITPALAGAVDIDAIQGAYHRHFKNEDINGTKLPGENVLEIVKITDGSAYFRTHLDFYNGHVCALSGVADLEGDRLVYRRSNDKSGCVLTLTFSDQGVSFEDRERRCQEMFCGARGSFEGEWFDSKSKRAIRYLQRLLDSRQYKEALAEREQSAP